MLGKRAMQVSPLNPVIRRIALQVFFRGTAVTRIVEISTSYDNIKMRDTTTAAAVT